MDKDSTYLLHWVRECWNGASMLSMQSLDRVLYVQAQGKNYIWLF